MLIAKLTGFILEKTGSDARFLIAGFGYLARAGGHPRAVPELEPVKLSAPPPTK
jgi:hypothetical protein